MLSKLLLPAALLLACFGMAGSTHTKQVSSVSQLVTAPPGTYKVQADASLGSSNSVNISDGKSVISAYGQVDNSEQGLADITLQKSGDRFSVVGYRSLEQEKKKQTGILCGIRQIGSGVYGAIETNINSNAPCQGEWKYVRFSDRIN